MTMTPIEEPDEQRAIGREGAGRGRRLLLGRERPCERQHRHDIGEAADEHRDPERAVEPERIAVEAGEGRAVVGVGRGERVDDFRKAVRTAVAEAVERRLQENGGADETEHHERVDQHRQHRELHLARLDLLAEIFRRAPDHEAGDEHGDDRDHKEAIEARADAARPDAAGEEVEHRHEPGERRERIEHRVDGAGAGAARSGGEQSRHRLSEADLLALEIAERRIDPERGQDRIAGGLGPIGDENARDEKHRHRREDRPALAEVADHPAEGEHRGGRNEEQRDRSRRGSSRRWGSRRDGRNWR